jgi:hypothetical protein
MKSDGSDWPADFKPVFAHFCDCGEKIPWHLFEINRRHSTGENYEHHCSCGAVWVDKGRWPTRKEEKDESG